MTKYRVSAVSYINTFPFIYGIEHSPEIRDYIDLSLDYPSECARKVLQKEADIGLVPVYLLYEQPDLQMITDYCIGADGAVDSVYLFSHKPLRQLDSILLDYQSRTSVNLVKVLANFFWKIKPKWQAAYPNFENETENYDAAVIIGDRAIRVRDKFEIKYDLAEQWKFFTGLPFVFAVWASNTEVDSEFIKVFNQSLQFGLNHIDDVIKFYSKKIQTIRPYIDPEYYLTKSISYTLSPLKKRAINKFFSLIEKL